MTLAMANVYVRRMKSLTMREFFHSPSLVKSLHAGQSLVVTSRGKPDLLVTKAGGRRKRTAAELRREARKLLSAPGKKINTVELIRDLR